MPSERTPAQRLDDILNAIGFIEDFVRDKSLRDFIEDKMSLSAVAYQLVIIGEAANHLPRSIKERCPGTPWVEIVGMRNRIVHGYSRLDPAVIWMVAREHLFPLRDALAPELERLLAEEKMADGDGT